MFTWGFMHKHILYSSGKPAVMQSMHTHLHLSLRSSSPSCILSLYFLQLICTPISHNTETVKLTGEVNNSAQCLTLQSTAWKPCILTFSWMLTLVTYICAEQSLHHSRSHPHQDSSGTHGNRLGMRSKNMSKSLRCSTHF